jgi:hypothetical protein
VTKDRRHDVSKYTHDLLPFISKRRKASALVRVQKTRRIDRIFEFCLSAVDSQIAASELLSTKRVTARNIS